MSSRRRSWTQVGDNQLEGAMKIIPSAKKFLSGKQPKSDSSKPSDPANSEVIFLIPE